MNSVVFMGWLLGFGINFFTSQTPLGLVRTVSLPVCKNHAIHPTMSVLVLNNAKNNPFSKNIVVVHVLFTNPGYRQLADGCWPLGSKGAYSPFTKQGQNTNM